MNLNEQVIITGEDNNLRERTDRKKGHRFHVKVGSTLSGDREHEFIMAQHLDTF